MKTKEKLQFGLQFLTVLIIAFLANKAIDSKVSHGPMGDFHPMKGEKTIVMQMDGDFDLETMDLDKITDMKKGENVFVFKMDGDFDLEKMDLDKISDINVDGESIEIMIDGQAISLPLDKMTEIKDKQHSCKDCEQDMICEDCEEKK